MSKEARSHIEKKYAKEFDELNKLRKAEQVSNNVKLPRQEWEKNLEKFTNAQSKLQTKISKDPDFLKYKQRGSDIAKRYDDLRFSEITKTLGISDTAENRKFLNDNFWIRSDGLSKKKYRDHYDITSAYSYVR